MVNGGGRMEGWKDGRLEIPPFILQDIGPLGPLPKKVPSPISSTQFVANPLIQSLNHTYSSAIWLLVNGSIRFN